MKQRIVPFIIWAQKEKQLLMIQTMIVHSYKSI